ncbi:MAG: DUF167 domain-containing protein [Pirellulaceae bacterium]
MIQRSGDHYRLCVHATPGAKRTCVGGQHDNALRVSVSVPADQGKANKAIIKALADALGLRRGQIELSSGMTNRRKVFLIDDASDELPQRVAILAAMT